MYNVKFSTSDYNSIDFNFVYQPTISHPSDFPKHEFNNDNRDLIFNDSSLWPSGIGSRLGRNRLWVRFLAVSDIYPMFIEPKITWSLRGSLGTYGLTQKLC